MSGRPTRRRQPPAARLCVPQRFPVTMGFRAEAAAIGDAPSAVNYVDDIAIEELLTEC